MSFLTHTSENVLWMSSSLLDGSGVRHGFSTRVGGVSPAPWDSLNLGVGRGDDMDRVRENYRRFCAALGVDEHRAVLSKQVHEDNIRHVTADDCGKGLFRDRDYTSVDAMVTDTPEIPLVVFSADCGIILLHDPVHGAVGADNPALVAQTVKSVLDTTDELEKEKKKKSFIFDQVMKAATLLTNAVSNLDDAMSTEGVGKQLDNIEGACAVLRDWVK